MTEKKYDIFISYRSEDGAQYARILQLQLEKIGYRVFLDYDELKRDRFGDDITHAIQSAPIFLMILTPLYLERCLDEGNWIQREIYLAIEGNKHFVPVNPDRKFKGIPEGLSPQIADIVENYQHSVIDFGQTLKVTFDLMVKNQIKPVVKPRHKTLKVWTIAVIFAIIIVCTCLVAVFYHHEDSKEEQIAQKEDLSTMRTELERKHKAFGLYLSPNLSSAQMMAIDDILNKMIVVKPDSLWMSQFEFTIGQWNGIMNKDYDHNQKDLPLTNISFGYVCMTLLDSLGNMSNIYFDLPSAEEWEYAAQGGINHESTLYAGSNDVDNVAWYLGNSDGHVHLCDGQQGKSPNTLDLFDMSGNVSELCKTPFVSGVDGAAWTVCGGNFNSPASEVTVSARAPFDTAAEDQTVGFRLVIRKQ